MVRMARAEVLDHHEVAVVHVCNRTVRRCFLFGSDPLTGHNYDHRKDWIETQLRVLAAQFGIDLLAYAILSNHFHLVLRTRPDVVATWDDTEVARRWRMLCPLRRQADGSAAEPTRQELDEIRRSAEKLRQIRGRLSSVSWWMRLLCQRIAMRANREEEQTGRFFQDRFKAVKLLDEASVLACAAYVDLNPVRAAIAETIEQSEHTSVRRRIDARPEESPPGNASPGEAPWGEAPSDEAPAAEAPAGNALAGAPAGNALAGGRDGASVGPVGPSDRFLSPLGIDELADRPGPVPSETAARCSDKGFLPMGLKEYLELLDWTARQVVCGKAGATCGDAPPVLQRLGLSPTVWGAWVRDFGRLFVHVAGEPEVVDAHRSHRTGRRFHLPSEARELGRIAA